MNYREDKQEHLKNRKRFETKKDAILERRVIDYLLIHTDLQAVKLDMNSIDFAILPKGAKYDPYKQGSDVDHRKVVAYVEVKGSKMKECLTKGSTESTLRHSDNVWLSVKKLNQIQYYELVKKKPCYVAYPYGCGEVSFIRYYDIEGYVSFKGRPPREGSTHDTEMIVSIAKWRFTVYDPETPNFLQDLCTSQ